MQGLLLLLLYPSIGVFDETLNLVPDKIDNENNFVKGFIMSGYIEYSGEIKDFNGEIRVLVEYTDENNIVNKVYYKYTN